MKFLIYLLPLVLLLQGCPRRTENWVSSYAPILEYRENIDKKIVFSSNREISNLGKIFFLEPLIFISEINQGVHIINNSNPEHPEKLGFINIDGCLDVSVKGNILFAENYTDLVAIDISDLDNIKLLSRTPNIFPELTPPDGGPLADEFYKLRPHNTVIIGWKKTEGQNR
jgi:hypothetical protein